MRRKQPKRRRSAAQWAKLLESWDRDAMTVAEFAKSIGASPGTVAWWCWRLKHTSATATSPDPPLRFVQLDVAPDVTALDGRDGWEFASADGHTLRVHGSIAPEVLGLVLDRMTRRRPR